jgi:ankyrin repeat protein
MEKGHDIKASLCISMQTLDSISFSTSLKDTHLHLSQLQDQSGCNIFHDIADCIVKESYLLEYLDILTSEFSDRYFEGSKDLIKQMLNQHGGRERLTPLMYAVKHNRRVSHNQLLLEKFVKLGGDFWRKDANGQSLVHMAAAQGFDAILVYLCFVLNMSYVENEKNGRSPLHLACLEGQVSTGMLLIVWNEELDLQDVEDFTPLHLAVLSSSYKLIRNLVIMGADLKVKDKKGETAFEIALSHGCDAGIIKLLVRSR